MNKDMMMLNYLVFFFTILTIFIMSFNMKNFHPIMIMIILLIFSILISWYLSIWKMNFMFSIMLFLILISGLLIIFLYFSSLISNKKIKFNLNKFLILSMILNLYILLMNNYYQKNFYLSFQKSNFNEINSLMKFNEINFQNIINIYMFPFNNFTILSMSFLLLSLFTIIKISLIKSSSLRKMI